MADTQSALFQYDSPGTAMMRLFAASNRHHAVPVPGARLEITTIWWLESRQNPQPGKAALRSAAFPGCGLAELSSSATGTRLRRTLVVPPRCALPVTAR